MSHTGKYRADECAVAKEPGPICDRALRGVGKDHGERLKAGGGIPSERRYRLESSRAEERIGDVARIAGKSNEVAEAASLAGSETKQNVGRTKSRKCEWRRGEQRKRAAINRRSDAVQGSAAEVGQSEQAGCICARVNIHQPEIQSVLHSSQLPRSQGSAAHRVSDVAPVALKYEHVAESHTLVWAKSNFDLSGLARNQIVRCPLENRER